MDCSGDGWNFSAMIRQVYQFSIMETGIHHGLGRQMPGQPDQECQQTLLRPLCSRFFGVQVTRGLA